MRTLRGKWYSRDLLFYLHGVCKYLGRIARAARIDAAPDVARMCTVAYDLCVYGTRLCLT